MAPRRSTRRSAAAAAASVASQTEGGDNSRIDDVAGEQDLEFQQKLRKKRTKRASDEAVTDVATNSRGQKKGSLSRLLADMPLEVLGEIFSQLHPLDILRLSRTTKMFRRMLLSVSSRSVWATALAGVPDMPPCPDDLTEPQYTRLAFENVCHVCGTSCPNPVWALRIRACAKCLSGPTFAHINDQIVQDAEENVDKEIAKLVPWGTSYFVGRSGINKCLVKNLRFIVDTLTHLPPGSKVRDEFKKGRRSKVAAVVSHAKTCDMWQMLLREDHRKGLGDQRELRRVAIEERLSELGYEREVEFLRPAMVDMTLRELDHGFTKIKGVKDSKDLTARQWNNMLQRGEIVAYMRDEIRPKRIRVEWMEALRARVVVLARLLPPVASAGYSVVPRVVDLHNFEAFRAVLEQPLEEGENTVTANSFADAVADLPDLLTQLETSKITELRSMLLSAAEGEGAIAETAGSNRLGLATSLFHCANGNCSGTIFDLNHALGHRCFSRPFARFDVAIGGAFGRHYVRFRYWQDGMDDPRRQMLLACELEEESGGKSIFAYSQHAAAAAAKIVQACDLDPSSTTSATMDCLDARFTCLDISCANDDGKHPIMDWRNAVRHMAPPYYVHVVPHHVKLLRREEEKEAKLLEAKSAQGACDLFSQRQRDVVGIGLRCLLCDFDIPRDVQEMKVHLDEVHDVLDPRLERDFAPTPDCFASLVSNVWM